MVSSVRCRLAAASFVSLSVLVAAAPAWAAPFNLTTPAAESFDDWPTAVATGTGFALAWQHYEMATGLSSIQIRRFAADGKPAVPAKQVVAPSVLVGHPRLLPAHSGKLGLTWLDMQMGLTGTTIEPVAGTIGKPAALTRSAATPYDVARLSNGNIGAAHVYFDVSNRTNPRIRAAVSVAGPSFTTVAKDAKLPLSDNPYTTPGSQDQAVVGDGVGGALAFYRDRVDGHLYVVKVSSKGVPATTRTRVSVATTYIKAAEMAYYGVQAVRLTDGRYAVVWTSTEASDFSKTGVRLRWLDTSGKPIGTAVQVNSSPTGTSTSPRLTALAGGRLGVSWIQDEGKTRYHRVRWFAAAGTPLTGVQTLRSDTEVWDPSGLQMTRMQDGRVLQVWRAYDATAKRYRIRGEFLTPPK